MSSRLSSLKMQKEMKRREKQQQPRTASAKPVHRSVIDTQLGTNLDTKCIASRKRIDERKR